MLLQFGVLLLLAGVGLAVDLDPDRTLVKLPGKCKSTKCKTTCVINSDPKNLELSPNTPCLTLEDKYDFHLDIGSLRISAHVNSLAVTIPFFSDSSSSIEDKKNAIIKQNFDASAVKSLMTYAYTRKVTVRPHNAEAILKAALFLRMDNVVETCITLLKSQNDMQQMANIMSELGIESEEFILKHVGDWSKPSQFVDLNSEVFLSILRSDKILNVAEANIFEVAYRWLQHKPTERAVLTYEVLQNVRYPLIDSNYLLQHVTHKIWSTNNTQIRHLVNDAIHYHLHPDAQDNFRQGCRVWPRNGTNKLVSVNWLSSETNMQMYDSSADKFEYLPNSPSRYDYCVVVKHGNLFAIGGSNTNEVNVFNLKYRYWKTVQSMFGPRRSASAAVAKGVIYVSGGEYSGALSTTESYNTLTNTWTRLPSMSQNRHSHRLIASGDYLYAIGGYNTEALTSVEKYKISTQQWTHVKSMLNARYVFGAAVLSKKIYVCGGYASSGSIADAEVFDVVLQTWTRISPMNTNKYAFSLIAIKNQLWAFKGYTASTEVYDPISNSWTEKPNKFDNSTSYWETVMINY